MPRPAGRSGGRLSPLPSPFEVPFEGRRAGHLAAHTAISYPFDSRLLDNPACLVICLENGIKVFELRPSVVRWQILPNVAVDAYAYNGQIPGPRIHIRQGDKVRINVTNDLPKKRRCIGTA